MKNVAQLLMIGGATWTSLWWTSDQQGQRLMNQGAYEAAAHVFQDPMRIGVAWFRAGEFEKAEQVFARVATPEAEYNRGNCLVMRGKYAAAIERFDRALELKPDWPDAEINRSIAVARRDRTKQEGADMGDQKIGADKLVFDKNKKTDGQETETDKTVPMTDSAMQAMWLRRVQTKPADFLKAKFAYQTASANE